MKAKQEFFTALGGRVKFIRGGYNITIDPILLAAGMDAILRAAPAGSRAQGGKNGVASVLDAGIGTGGAALALLDAWPELKITGVDISGQMLDECAENARINGQKIELIQDDIMTWHTGRTFDCVMTNPPYFRGTPRGAGDGRHQRGGAPARGHDARIIAAPASSSAADAHESNCGAGPHHNADIGGWVRACLRRVRPRGYFCCIIDAGAAAEVIAALRDGRAGGLEITPLFGAAGKPAAERVVISARLGVRSGSKIYAAKLMNG